MARRPSLSPCFARRRPARPRLSPVPRRSAVAVLLLAGLTGIPLCGASATVTPAGPLGLPAPGRSGLTLGAEGRSSAGLLAVGARAEGHWVWPLEPEPAVVRRFQAAPTPWGAGHRGVDLAASVGQPVVAAAGGVVSYAGVIAGRGVIVVQHSAGVRSTYEPITQAVAVGISVRAGQQIAVVSAVPGHCAPQSCVHWGLIRGGVYVDPLSVFGLSRPILLPVLDAG